MHGPVLPLGERVLGVFAAPATTFRALGEPPPWADVLALGLALLVLDLLLLPLEPLLAFVRAGTDGWRPEEGTLRALAYGGGAAALAASHLALAFGGAALLQTLFTFVLGGRGGYRDHLSVVCHALLVLAAGSLAVLPLQRAAGRIDARLDLAFFAPALREGGAVAAALARIDLFSVWALVVVAAGAAAAHGRISWSRAGALLLALYALALLVRAG